MPQTLDSSLLYTKEDGSQDFVHDTYNDFFAAKGVNKRLESGIMTARDAYLFFTRPRYSNNSKTRQVVYREVFSLFMYICSEETAVNISNYVIKNYSEKEGGFDEILFTDLITIAKIVAERDIDKNAQEKIKKELVELTTTYPYFGWKWQPEQKYVHALKTLGMLDRELAFKVIDSEFSGYLFPEEMNIPNFTELIKNHFNDPDLESMIINAIKTRDPDAYEPLPMGE